MLVYFVKWPDWCKQAWSVSGRSPHSFQGQQAISLLPLPLSTLSKKKNAQEKEIQYRLRTELVCYWFNRQLKTPLSSFKSPKLCYRQEWHRMSHSECQGHGAMIQPSPGEQNKHWWVNVFKSSFFFFFCYWEGFLAMPHNSETIFFFKAIFFDIKPPNLHMAKIPYIKSKDNWGQTKDAT